MPSAACVDGEDGCAQEKGSSKGEAPSHEVHALLFVQALTALEDQIQLDLVSKGEDAVGLWVHLSSTALPRGMRPIFTVQQAQCMMRVLELRGQGHAYLAAWALTVGAWRQHGLVEDALSPEGWRAIRQLVYEAAPQDMLAPAKLHAVAGQVVGGAAVAAGGMENGSADTGGGPTGLSGRRSRSVALQVKPGLADFLWK